MVLFCVISANSGSFRAHCVKVHVRYLISWWVLVIFSVVASLGLSAHVRVCCFRFIFFNRPTKQRDRRWENDSEITYFRVKPDVINQSTRFKYVGRMQNECSGELTAPECRRYRAHLCRRRVCGLLASWLRNWRRRLRSATGYTAAGAGGTDGQSSGHLSRRICQKQRRNCCRLVMHLCHRHENATITSSSGRFKAN